MNKNCVHCSRLFTKTAIYKERRSKWDSVKTEKYKAKRREYARLYRQTEKGKQVNRVGFENHRTKYSDVEGSHTTQEWIALKEQYDNQCLCCKKHESELDGTLQQDHVIPVTKGGSNWITNIQPLCGTCNGMGGKGTKIIEYRPDWQKFYAPFAKVSSDPSVQCDPSD